MNRRQDRQSKSSSQRDRRLSRRNCGNCGNRADTMIKWGDGQHLAICQMCLSKLTNPSQAVQPYCAYYEVPSVYFHLIQQLTADTVDDTPEETPAMDTAPPQGLVRAAWEWLWDL